MKKGLMIALFVTLFVVLSINIMRMPSNFTTDAPSYNDTVRHYLENSVDETGATNIIAAILTDYRAFDTLGETIVLFTSIVAVVSILRPSKTKSKEDVNHG